MANIIPPAPQNADTWQPHELASLFPPMPKLEFDDLVEDIRRNGQVVPIVLYEDKVLDGVHRVRACAEIGIEPDVRPYRGDKPLDFVISANLRRRHLNESQRAMVAAKLSEGSKHGGDKSKPTIVGLDVTAASDALNVSSKSTERARKVRDNAAESVVSAVESGTITVSDAAKVADRPEHVQEQALRKVLDGESKTVNSAANKIAPKPKSKPKQQGKPKTVKETMNELHIGPATRSQAKEHMQLAIEEASKHGEDWRYRMMSYILGGLSAMTEPERLAKNMKPEIRDELEPKWAAAYEHLGRFIKEATR